MVDFIQRYWLGVFFAGVLSLMGYAWKRFFTRFKKEIDEQRLIKDGVLALLHDRLYQVCKHYSEQEYITAGQLNNIEHLYESYHNLGGNGTGTELFNRCKNMRIKHE